MNSALVTGADRGIGAALCEELGAKVIPISRKDGFDLALPEGRRLVLDLIEKKMPDLVINNAGFGLYGPVHEHAIEEERAMVEVNILAVQEITWAAIRTWIKSGRKGTVLNIASVAGFFEPFPQFTTYAACKRFVIGFSRGVDFELQKFGIRVLVSCPGQVNTDFRERAGGRKQSLGMDPKWVAKRMLKQVAMGKGVDIFDWRYRFLPLITRLIPKKCLTWSIQNLR